MESTTYTYLEKYFGAPELRLHWEDQPATHLGAFNMELGVLEMSGPLLEADITFLTEALRSYKIGSDEFIRVVNKVNQDVVHRNPVLQLHRDWCDALQKSVEQYQEWCYGLTGEEREYVKDWTRRLLLGKAMEHHREEQLAAYGPDGISPLDEIFQSLEQSTSKRNPKEE